LDFTKAAQYVALPFCLGCSRTSFNTKTHLSFIGSVRWRLAARAAKGKAFVEPARRLRGLLAGFDQQALV
jgi:hypothetical protein